MLRLKLVVIQLVKKSPSLMESEVSLPCPQEPATGPYPEPDESSLYVPNLFNQVPF